MFLGVRKTYLELLGRGGKISLWWEDKGNIMLYFTSMPDYMYPAAFLTSKSISNQEYRDNMLSAMISAGDSKWTKS